MARANFRLGWFRIEIAPRPKVVLDVRRTLAGNKKAKTTKPKTIKSVSGVKPKRSK